MAAATQEYVPNKSDIFYSCVDHLFNNWTALKYAVQLGMGGAESAAKAKWLVDVVDKFFRENDDLYPDEVEEFISQILNTEFNLLTEDGSLQLICEKLCRFFRLYERKETEELDTFVKTTLSSKDTAVPCKQKNHTNQMPQLENNLENMSLNSVLQNTEKSLAATSNQDAIDMENTADENLGWQTVRKGQKK